MMVNFSYTYITLAGLTAANLVVVIALPVSLESATVDLHILTSGFSED